MVGAGEQLIDQLVRGQHQRDAALGSGQGRQIGACLSEADATLQKKRRVGSLQVFVQQVVEVLLLV